MTRAKTRLFLSFRKNLLTFYESNKAPKMKQTVPSRYLSDLPKGTFKWVDMGGGPFAEKKGKVANESGRSNIVHHNSSVHRKTKSEQKIKEVLNKVGGGLSESKVITEKKPNVEFGVGDCVIHRIHGKGTIVGFGRFGQNELDTEKKIKLGPKLRTAIPSDLSPFIKVMFTGNDDGISYLLKVPPTSNDLKIVRPMKNFSEK
mmetsp:Transcript_6446/g.9044  ORF Transcript_6446/g.9044 Transcript_6446/m.9044 type:complete len:202 (-) Transcript_6446:11-616(-)